MDWIIERRERFFLKVTTQEDRNLLEASLSHEPDQRKAVVNVLATLGWQGGPQGLMVDSLSESPTIGTCVSHDEDGRPRWQWAFEFREAATADWRNVLLKHGKVAFARIG